MKKKLTYKSAGVDIEASDRLVGNITRMIQKQKRDSKLKSTVGGYASLYEVTKKEWVSATTDGVGTKLKLAIELGIHHTVGIDLVAMSVNDLICSGSTPRFFLDYFATGKLKLGVASEVISGIVKGCELANCALVGGETAEMPDFYSPGEYDLAGFAVGTMDPKHLLPKKVKPGDILLGLPSSGFHSNGYSLLRRLLPKSGIARKRLMKSLLTPTRIYVRSVESCIQKNLLSGLSHITGSGFLNVPRMNEKVSYMIELPEDSELPQVFSEIFKRSGLSLFELSKTFNMGVGLVMAVPPKNVKKVLSELKKSGEKKVFELGEVVQSSEKGSEVILRKKSQVLGYEYVCHSYA